MASRERRARQKQIKEKEKEIRDLRKEEFQASWREYKTRIYLSFERLLITAVSCIIFVLHCVDPPDEDSADSVSLIDRVLTPMAYGGDFLVQFGLFVACAAFLYVHPGLLLVIDAATAALIVLELCLNWPGAFYGAVLAIYLLSLLDIILHTIMVGKAIMSIRLHQKNKSLDPESHYAEPEGWSWGMVGPRYSSAAGWTGKSGSRMWHSPKASEAFSTNQPKKSLLARARERMQKDRPFVSRSFQSHEPPGQPTPSISPSSSKPETPSTKKKITKPVSKPPHSMVVRPITPADSPTPSMAPGATSKPLSPKGKQSQPGISKKPPETSIAGRRESISQKTSHPNASVPSTTQSRPRAARVPAPRSVAQGSRR